MQRINNLILADKRVTVKELSLKVGVGEASLCRIMKQLQVVSDGFREFWQMPTVCSELWNSPGCIILNQRRRGYRWNGCNTNSPRKKKFRTASAAEKVMVTMFFNSEGLLHLYILSHVTIINPDVCGTLKKLQTRLCRIRPHRQKQDVFLLHDNARPHTSHKTTGEITKLGWTTLKPPYGNTHLTALICTV